MENAPKFFLAVDAGGTKAEFLLADTTTELARVRVGSIKTLNTSPEIAEQNFVFALRELERMSGISPRELWRTCIGTAGFSVASVTDWLREQHRRHAGGELIVCGDEAIALDAAFEGHRGVLALAGTGSNVVGRSADGQRVSAGGWGPVIGDEGSGHWIGLEAVRAIFGAVDERRTTTLGSEVLRTWGLTSLEQLIHVGNTAPPLKFAELTPAVVQCADKGDSIATQVLSRAGDELARLVDLVIGQMQAVEGSAFVVPEVAVAGGILQGVPAVRNAMTAALRRSRGEIVVRSEAVDAVNGALWRARHVHNDL